MCSSDLVYLTEPLVKSTEFVRSPRELPAQTWLWVCDPVVEIATRGGAATMYPEFQDVVKQAPKPAPLPPPARGATRVTGPGQQQQGR